MAKGSGGTRSVSPTSDEYSKRFDDYSNSIASGGFDTDKSFFNTKNGGSLLYTNGRRFDKFEYDAAQALALDGNVVKMTPETGEMYASAKYKGRNKFSDGKVFAEYYEQRTPKPSKEDLNYSVKNAIEHAKSKGASIALIYDAHSVFHRNNIKEGMELYMKLNAKSEHNSVKTVIVIDSKKQPHYWSFD